MNTELLRHVAEMVRYDPDTGSMTWRERSAESKDSKRWNSRYAGTQAGTIDDKGYRRILVRSADGSAQRVRAHQVAWFILSGENQSGEIDHINHDKLDNRASNLRDVSKQLNQRNGTRKSNNTSGVPGVCWHKQRKKWCAQASVDGKHYHIGLFDDISDAEREVLIFREKHGFTARHGAIVRAAAQIGQSM